MQGRVAVITGGGSGIGEATAIGMAAEGATLAVVDISADNANKVRDKLVASGAKAMAVQVDVTNEAQVNDMVKQVIDQFGRLDILVNQLRCRKRISQVFLRDQRSGLEN